MNSKLNETLSKLIHNYYKMKELIIDNDDGSITVYGDVTITNPDMWNVNGRLPVQFHKIDGDFNCTSRQLNSMAGCPQIVLGNFYFSGNNATDLIGGPEKVLGDYSCYSNPLTSLDGLPKTSPKLFTISYSKTLPLLRLVAFDKISFGGGARSVQRIMNRHVGKKPVRQAIIQCQRELIDAGLAENAAL